MKTLVTSLRSASAQVSAAIGRQGLTLSLASLALGILCGLAVVGTLVFSMDTEELAHQRRTDREVVELNENYRAFMLVLKAMNSAPALSLEEKNTLQQAWGKLHVSLEALCQHSMEIFRDVVDQQVDGQGVCISYGVRGRFEAALATLDQPSQLADPAVLSDMLLLSQKVSGANVAAGLASHALVGKISEHYRTALAVLGLSTLGFMLAGLALFVLVGRTGALLVDQSRKVERTSALLQETMDALPAGVVLYDADERLVMHNEAAIALNPALHGNPVGRKYEDLLRELEKRDAALGLPRQGTVDEWIARFRAPGQRQLRQADNGRWFEWTEVSMGSGWTVGLRTDVTDLRQAQVEAERSKEEYQKLVASLVDVVFKIDFHSGIITFVSASGEEFFGKPAHGIVGTSIYDLMPPEERDRHQQALADAQSVGKDVNEIALAVQAAGGLKRHVEMRYRLGKTADGTPEILGVMRDVTERLALTMKLEEEMARLKAIVQSSGAQVVLTDRNLSVLMVNHEFCRFWGVASEEIVGKSLREINSALDPQRHRDWLDGDTLPARYVRGVQISEGRTRVFSVTASPVFDDARSLRQIVFLAVDDTERKEAEEAMFHSERLALLGEVAATVAHDIAQPLQVISIAKSSAEEELAQAAESGSGPDLAYVEARLRRIGEQVERANRIVGDLRTFVRADGHVSVSMFSVAAAIQGAVDMTRHGIEKAGITLSVRLPESSPLVQGHIGRLEQVLINLMNNARDAGASAITVEAAVHEDGDSIRLAVNDNGPGIPDNILPRLFHQFVTTKPVGKGTGLGLRICQRIVKEMNGTISAANRPGGGARFEIELPIAPS